MAVKVLERTQKRSPSARRPELLLELNRGGEVAVWHPLAERLYGYTADEMVGRSAAALFPVGLVKTWGRALDRAKNGESIGAYKTIHKTSTGTHLDVEIGLVPRGNGRGFAVRLLHSAPRTRTQELLRESTAWMRAILETAVDGIMTANEFGMVEYMNPAAERMFGYSTEEVVEQHVEMLIPMPDIGPADEPEDPSGMRIARIIGLRREVVGRKKDGTPFPLELSVSEVRLDNRRIYTGILHDITQRKRAQEEKDQLLRDLNKRNVEITCLYRVGELIRSRQLVNEVFEGVAKYIGSAFLYPTIARARITFDGETYLSQPFEPTPWKLSADIFVGGRYRGSVQLFYVEERPTRYEGPFLREERDLIDAIALVMSATIERREAEVQIIQASKLASIGELAAGVGHEINNPVNGILNLADILSEQFPADSRNRQFIDLIHSEAERIAGIVRNLLTFSRQDREHHSPARLFDIVEAVLSLSRKKIEKSHVHLAVDVPENLPRIRCRSEQLQQVVMNLIINALHALDEKHPGTDPDKLLSLRARKMLLKGRHWLRLTVEDHGTGIAPAHMDRLFDPFFTTKGREIGTGLGLSVSDGIVKEHGGRMSVESEVGRYARFHVDLPLGDDAEAGKEATQKP